MGTGYNGNGTFFDNPVSTKEPIITNDIKNLVGVPVAETAAKITHTLLVDMNQLNYNPEGIRGPLTAVLYPPKKRNGIRRALASAEDQACSSMGEVEGMTTSNILVHLVIDQKERYRLLAEDQRAYTTAC